MRKYGLAVVVVAKFFSTSASADIPQVFVKGSSGLCLAANGESNLTLTTAKCEMNPHFLINLGPNGRNIIFTMLDSNTVRCLHLDNPDGITSPPATATVDQCNELTFWNRAGAISASKFVLAKNAFDDLPIALCLEEQVSSHSIVVDSCDDGRPGQKWNIIEAVAP